MKIIFHRKFLKQTIVALLLPAFLIACGGSDQTVVNTTTTPTTGLVSVNNFHHIDIGDSNQALISATKTPRLASVNNFRDIAIGDSTTPYHNTNGKTLRQGVFYRANVLTLSAQDLVTVNTLSISAVYDLRTPTEIVDVPDILPTGATYTNINILGSAGPQIPIGIDSPEKAIAFMQKLNREYVTEAIQRARFAELFKALATSDNAQLFHCTSGKDRTGWATAVLLSLVDVPKDVIIHDYMLTNTYMASTISELYNALLAEYGKRVADIYLPAFVVHQSYIEASFDQVLKSYGSMNNYITYGLGLDAATQTRLRNRLLNS